MIQMALIADIHGNLPALEAVVDDIVARGISRVINLGDHLSGPLWPRETADFLMRQSWVSIAGNHDRQVAFDDPATHGISDRFTFERLTTQHLSWLSTLPSIMTLDDVGLFLCHGTPGDDRDYLLERPDHGQLRLASATEISARLVQLDARVIACGHSHQPRIVCLPNGTTIVNPGSIGLQAYADCGANPHVSETGAPLARYALLEFTHAQPRITFAAIEYDHHRAARQAAANDRPDWASALRTGYAVRA